VVACLCIRCLLPMIRMDREPTGVAMEWISSFLNTFVIIYIVSYRKTNVYIDVTGIFTLFTGVTRISCISSVFPVWVQICG
ncbi:MAG: hypothetical protein PHY64_05810, partial [Eubacteriales bacterium]|nr:hypothetical protein [Eubacteriales bacterium]